MLRATGTSAGSVALLSALFWTTCFWGQSGAGASADECTRTNTVAVFSSPNHIRTGPVCANESTGNSAAVAETRGLRASERASRPSVDWKGLRRDSLQFLVVMNAFRVATEPGTRAALHNPLFSGYIRAVTNMHGWDDGDPFYVNYIGHPMQGAVSSFIWTNRDPQFNHEHISRTSSYVKSKLRAGAYSYVLSVMFELGPLSEGSIGQIQRYHPANGFVDHVVTPTVGLLWSVGEDAIDNSLVRYIERHTDNRLAKIVARSGLNPARSFANLMGWKYPWYRTNRPAPTSGSSSIYYTPVANEPAMPPPGVAPFQFNIHSEVRTYLGSKAPDPCVGGGAEIGFRVANDWQVVGEVTGCKQTGMPPNTTGDALTYVIGPQWTSRLSSRWTTHARVLVGGNKVTQELFFPEIKKELKAKYKGQSVFPPLADQYTMDIDSNAFTVVAGAGLDYKFNNALLFRSGLDYSHTWNSNINNLDYRNSLKFSSGLVLNMGTW